jgi:ribosomal protein S8
MLVVAKQQYNKEFFHLILAIKKASDKNSEFVFFKKQSSHSLILKLLLAEGFIISFQEHPNFLVIRLRSTIQNNFNTKSFSVLKTTHRLSRKNLTVSLQELVSLQRREGASTYYILTTDQGLLTSFSAIEKGIGGKLLLKIF